MMRQLVNVARWEWFKLRRRWMPWVILAVLVLVSQLSVWGSYIGWQRTETRAFRGSSELSGIAQIACAQVLDPNFKPPQGLDRQVVDQLRAVCARQADQHLSDLQDLRKGFELPGSIPNAMQVMQMIALVCLGVLTASLLGSEYGAGTLRTVLARGTPRAAFLGGKFLLLAMYVAGALLVIVAAIAISSAIAGAIAPVPLAGEAPDASWANAALSVGKAWFSMQPYIAFTAMGTIIVRASAPGTALGVGYVIAEQIAVAIFNQIFDWFYRVANLLPAHNISLWTNAGAFGSTPPHRPSDLQIFFVLLAYFVVFAAIAFRTFLRRDVTGASSG